MPTTPPQNPCDHADPCDYDVLIVGGRPAGATLAARLGAHGLRVLLLERATFPSAPPASSPAIYAPALRLLDEIGADEADYARGTPPIRRWALELGETAQVLTYLPLVWGRDYGYAIDRARFDDALWRHAARCSSVTARQDFAVSDLLRDGERVIGVTGRASDGPLERLTAHCVVGADGRFSLVARKAGARTHDERHDLPTTCYYAYWENVAPYDGAGPTVHMYGPGYGYGFLLMDSADGRTAVVTEGQAALFTAEPGQAEAFYMQTVRAHPHIWRRLAHAERVTGVHGMRKIGNLYRTAGGPGWALVGDALHQKDPLDGQGIFDALFTAKALAQALVDWLGADQTWEQALAAYEAAVRAETYPMYQATLERVQRDLYTRQPAWAFKTTLRWVLEDPEYARRFSLLITRAIDPAHWLPASVAWAAIGRGLLKDVRKLRC